MTAELPLLEDVGPGASRLRLVCHLPFFVPLRLAEDDHARRARVIELQVETHDLAVQDDLVVVDHLHPLDRAHALLVANQRGVLTARVVRVTPERVVVHHVLGRELAIAVVELHALLQLDPPGSTVLGHLCALGQPGIVATRRDVDLEQPLERRIVLDVVVGGAVDPGAHVVPIRVDEAHHQSVHFALAGGGLGLGAHACQRQE